MHKKVTKRIMALFLSVCMIAGIVDLSSFTVYAANAVDRVEIDTSYEYTGRQIQPGKADLKVYDINGQLMSDGDYNIIGYGPNINADRNGTKSGSVVVRAVGEEGEGTTATFSITPKDISSQGITVEADPVNVIQSASNIQTTVRVTDSNNPNPSLAGSPNAGDNNPDIAYTYTFSDNSISDQEETKKATVTVTGRNNYTGSATAEFTITRYDANKLTFDFGNAANNLIRIYSGEPIELTPGTDATLSDVDFAVKYDGAVLPVNTYVVSYSDNMRASTEAKVTITIVSGPYRGLSQTANFTIRKRFGKGSFDASKQVYGVIKDKNYKGSGNAVTLTESEITLIDPDYGPDRPISPTKYEITGYENNTSVSTEGNPAYVTVQGKEEYSNNMKIPFNITAAVLSADIIHIDSSACVYNGSDQFQNLRITVGEGNQYIPGVDFQVTKINSEDYTKAGKHKVRVVAIATGQFQPGYVDVEFEIAARRLDDAAIHVFPPTDSYTYNGTAHTPRMTIQYGSTPLREGTDYTLSYSNNINAGEATVTATGTGNYTGTVSRTFTIKPQELNSGNTKFLNLPTSEKYTGNPIEPMFTLQFNGNRNLSRGTDYTVEYSNQINVGTATVTIHGAGNYTGSVSSDFQITKRGITDGTRINVPTSLDYTGEQIIPEVTITYNNTTVSSDNYELSYGENTKVGTNAGSVTIKGKNNYEGETTVTFTINRRNISVGDYLRVTSIDGPGGTEYDFIHGQLEELYYRYTGQDIRPGFQVSFGGEGSGMHQMTMKEGEDFSIALSANREIGTARAVITGEGNYTGSKTVQFRIKGCLEDFRQSGGFTSFQIPVQVYSRKPIIPENAEITFNGVTLQLGTDYEFQNCENNTEVTAGNKALAWITGKGNYYGEMDALEFEIRPLSLKDDDLEENKYNIDGIEDSYIYSGLPIEPTPVVTHNGDTLEADRDYSLDYNPSQVQNPNINVGGWTLRVNGDGHYYTGSKDINYQIEQYDISAGYAKVEIQGVEDVVLDALKNPDKYDYDGGAALSPSDKDAVIQSRLQVMYTPVGIDGTEGVARSLTESEYTVSYENNRTIGTATITITGIGNFKGSITEEFQIRGDLAGDNTRVEVEDWTYTPAKNGVITNTPEPKVTYFVTYQNGFVEEIVLEKVKDYTVAYRGNENATLNGTHAAVQILSDGATSNKFVNQAEEEFQIAQRDLSRAVGEDKDELLSVTGLNEDGYGYTGSPIVPELAITCDSIALVAGTGAGTYDYEISAVNNTNVYTYAPNSVGEQIRLYPEVTVAAKKDADGNYTGNYCGEFRLPFTIKPREISKETVDELVKVTGVNDTYDYSGEKIEFPLPSDPSKNAIGVTWSEGNVRTPLVEGQDYTIRYEDNIKIGEAKIYITAQDKSNYTGEYIKTFRIMASIGVVDDPDPQKRYITLSYKDEIPYGITAVYPDLVFEDYSGILCGVSNEPYILEQGKDFEIVLRDNQGDAPAYSQNNIDVGSKDAEDVSKRPTVVIRGIGNYKGVITKYYTITPMNLSEDEDNYVTAEFKDSINDEENQNAYIYTGNKHEPTIVVRNREQVMVPNRDYTVVEYGNNVEISTEESRAYVLVRAVEGRNYTGEKKFYFNIIPRSISNMTLTITSGTQVFDRKEKRPEVEITYQDEDKRTVTLTEDDYDIAYENNVNAASASDENAPTITVTGKGAYGGRIVATFTIEKESFGDAGTGDVNEDIIITGAPQIYTGEAVTTTFTAEAADGTKLEEGVDFEVSESDYSNNTDAGTGYAVVHGIGNYAGSRKAEFAILPAEGDLVIEEIPDQTFGAKALEPELTVSLVREDLDLKVALVKDRDYEVEEWTNNINAGTATVKVKGINNFVGEGSATFEILPLSIGTPEEANNDIGLTIVESKPLAAIGQEVFLTPEDLQLVYHNTEGGVDAALTAETDYQVTYENNAAIGVATATIHGIGNYTGTMQAQFKVLGNMELADVEEIPGYLYTGEEMTPKPVVSFAGEALTEGEDYIIEGYRDNVMVGTATIILKGIGEWYSGTREVYFSIIPPDGEIVIDAILDQTYTTKEIRPAVTVALNTGEERLRFPMVEGRDYEVSYSNNIDAGTALVKVTAKGNFKGEATAEFTIEPLSMGTPEEPYANMQLSAIEDQKYTGRGVTPGVQLAYRNAEEGVDLTLEAGRDYRVTYSGNVAVGTATATVIGLGNFTGVLETQFRILGDLSLASVAPIPVQEYTGNPVTPVPEVSFTGTKLTEGVDYTVSYENNIERGTASAILTGQGFYTGTKTVTFDISRQLSDHTVVRGVASAYPYSGNPVTPVVLVEDDGVILTEGVDYTVSYRDNVEAGTASIVITGIEKYQGQKIVNFQIMPRQLGRAEISQAADQIYNGKKTYPKVKVSMSGKVLTEGTDYSLVYVNNKNPGKANIIVRGIGNYGGAQTVSFNIRVPKLTGVKASKYDSSSVTFSWNKNSVVTGYEIYNSKNRRVVRVKKASTVKAKVNNLKAASSATFRVRAYVTSDGRTYYGDFTKVKGVTAPKSTKITSIASTKAKQITLKWKKISKASGYEVYRSTSLKGKYKKIASASKTSYTDKKATGGKTYYYKIRVRRKVSGKNYYSSYCDVKSIQAMR